LVVGKQPSWLASFAFVADVVVAFAVVVVVAVVEVEGFDFVEHDKYLSATHQYS